MTIVLFVLISTLWMATNQTTYAAENNQKGIPVLLYHHILKKSENAFPNDSAIMDCEEFEAQMKYLYDHGFYTATLSDLALYLQGRKSLPAKTVVITFDDGHKTNYLYAYPILKKYGFHAGAFLITNRISQTPVPFDPRGLQFLSWPEIKQMTDVFQFASHTNGLHYTIDGKSALLREPDDVVLKDLKTSKDLVHTEFFAYPFGAYNQKTIEQLKITGYKYAFTTEGKYVKPGDDPYELGRFVITPSTTESNFEQIVNGESSTYGWHKYSGKWYYLDSNGNKWTGWLYSDGHWYYLDQNGAMGTGWIKSGTKWYYLEKNGEMRTGWLKLNNKWYYLDSSGAMRTGWINIGQKWYFFYKDGHMAANTVINGYRLGLDGAWQ